MVYDNTLKNKQKELKINGTIQSQRSRSKMAGHMGC